MSGGKSNGEEEPKPDFDRLLSEGKINGSPMEAMTSDGLKRLSKVKISSIDCSLWGHLHVDHNFKPVLLLSFTGPDERLLLCEENSLKKSVQLGLHLSKEHALELRRLLDERLEYD